MIKLNFAHLCEYAFILNNNTPGIIGIFSKITSKSKPVIRDNIAVILNINPNDTDEHIVRIVLKSPSGSETLNPIEGEIGPAYNKDQSLGLIINIQNIKLEEEGVYNIEIFVDEKRIETLSFTFEVEKT